MFTFEPLTDMLVFDGFASKHYKTQVSLFPLLLLDHKEWPASVPPHTEGVRASTSPLKGKLGHEYVAPPPLMVYSGVIIFTSPAIVACLFPWARDYRMSRKRKRELGDKQEVSGSMYLGKVQLQL